MKARPARDGRGVSHQRERGFTLVELVIVIVIIAILVAVGLPSYRDSVMKSRRIEAKEMLWAAANRQQQYFTMNNAYTTDATGNLKVPTTSQHGYYTLSITAGHSGNISSSYSMSATAVSGSSQYNDSDCGTFTLGSLGQQTVSGSQTFPLCWS